jgi:hypothetical protein
MQWDGCLCEPQIDRKLSYFLGYISTGFLLALYIQILTPCITKQSQLMHSITVYLFIFFVHLLSDMFRQVTMQLSRGLYQITEDVHEM